MLLDPHTIESETLFLLLILLLCVQLYPHQLPFMSCLVLYIVVHCTTISKRTVIGGSGGGVVSVQI